MIDKEREELNKWLISTHTEFSMQLKKAWMARAEIATKREAEIQEKRDLLLACIAELEGHLKFLSRRDDSPIEKITKSYADGVIPDTFNPFAEIERLKAGITAVRQLIDSSIGVYGLHMNGDIAYWGDLEEGGRFEEWLIEFNVAEESPQPVLACNNEHSQEGNCPKCNQSWDAHDFGVPAPYCP